MATRRLVLGLGLVIAGPVLVVAALGLLGQSRVAGVDSRPLRPLRVRADAALRERGRHLAELSCVGCHSINDSLPLAGSDINFLHEPGRPTLGVLTAPNLTPGGPLADASDAELGRAIREGLGRDGRPLLGMPAGDFHGLSDRDLAALIACLRAQPAVARATPPRRLSPLAYVLLGARSIETSRQPAVAGAITAPREGPTPDYGAYLTAYLGCADCHGADFRGGRNPLAPRGPDLRPIVTRAAPETFRRALQEGVGRDGHALDPTLMPWPVFRRLRAHEVAAVHQWLRRQTGAVRPGS